MRLNRAESSRLQSLCPPCLCRGHAAEDQALPRVQVLSAASRGAGMAAGSLLPGRSARSPLALLGEGATRGCEMRGSRCIQMCSQIRVLPGLALLPALPGLGALAGVPVPSGVRGRTGSQISQGLPC